MPGHRFHKQGAFRKETKYRADPRQTLDLHLAAPKLRESCDLAGAQLVPPQDRQETAGYKSGTHGLSFFFFFFFFLRRVFVELFNMQFVSFCRELLQRSRHLTHGSSII
jgi:hypothetical protein